MRTLLLTGCLAATALLASAQTSTAVSEATVRRVLTTLAADDMQGRPTGQAGNLKAAEFLAAEFKRIGLQPLPGATGFMQEFPAYTTTLTSLAVTLNGQPVPATQTFALATQPQLAWTEKDSVRVLVLGPGEKLQPHYRELFRPAKNTLVLFDPAQAPAFEALVKQARPPRLRATAGRARYVSSGGHHGYHQRAAAQRGGVSARPRGRPQGGKCHFFRPL